MSSKGLRPAWHGSENRVVQVFAPKGQWHVARGWRFLPAPGEHVPTKPSSPVGATVAHRLQQTAVAPLGLERFLTRLPGAGKERQPQATCLSSFGAKPAKQKSVRLN